MGRVHIVGLLIVHNGLITSDDDILRLYGEGLSIRAIANELGLSKSTVHRIILAAKDDDLDLDEDDDLDSTELALLDASADDYQPVPPFTFVGIVPGDGIKTKDDWRYMDAADHSVSALDIYRFCAELEEDDRYDESAAIEADLERRYAEAGLRRVDHIGYHCWEPTTPGIPFKPDPRPPCS